MGLLEHDLEDHLRQIAPAETPIRGRLSRQARHFPITPEVLIRPDERGQLYLMFVSAADRPGRVRPLPGGGRPGLDDHG